jgi:hypothetical protein
MKLGVDTFHEYLIIGAGPTGITCLEELLSRGVNREKILLVDSNFESFHRKVLDSPAVTPQTIVSVAQRERFLSGVGKSGVSVLDVSKNDSPLFYWGLSCYRLSSHLVKEWDLELEKYDSGFLKALKAFSVQGPNDIDHTGFIFPKKTRRKVAAEDIIHRNQSFQHSWLALTVEGENACTLTGGCFEFCNNSAPIDPRRLLAKVCQEWGEVEMLNSKVLTLNHKAKSVTLEAGQISYGKLFLCLGATNSQSLLAECLNSTIRLKGSPVVLVPFISATASPLNDFFHHFSYNDLFLPVEKNEKMEGFCQIYLPSVEIAGRILAAMPGKIAALIHFIGRAFKYRLFRHIGICMIFLPETELLETRGEARASLSKLMPRITKDLKRSHLFPFPLFSRFLLKGASRHLGAISRSGESDFGFKSKLWNELAKDEVYLFDTSILPSLQPGPHTLIAVALVKYLFTELEL